MSDDRLLVPYGVKVSFQQDSPIKFADFILTFAGDRIIKASLSPRDPLPGFHDHRGLECF